MNDAKRTIVEEGTEFKGALTSSCPIEVRGRIEGELSTPTLSVSAAGAVHGKVKVGQMKSEGEVSGHFEADTVELSGRVRDGTVIVASSLDVKLTSADAKMQVTFGDCELVVGDEPKRAEANERQAAAAAASAGGGKKKRDRGGNAGSENGNSDPAGESGGDGEA